MSNENFSDIDFHQGLPSHSFIDKKSGVRINIGRPSLLPPDLKTLQDRYGSVLMGIQESGMARDRLDRTCTLLALNCKSLGIEIVVSKSDRAFDSQWYILGDIEGLLRAARDELVRPPFTPALHDQISRAVAIVLGPAITSPAPAAPDTPPD